MERISVAIRVKPTNRQEASNGTQWKVEEKTISLQNGFGASIKGQIYTIDKIFGTSTRNSEIYQHAKDLVFSAVSGVNGTVLAYGQTSSGKTYTMQGSASDPGVIPLAMQDVFINIDKIEDREFLVRVSYMEIYNEEINDLLAPENRKLQIYESIERGTFVAGLSEEIADSVEQVIAVLERGEAQRQFAETDMNVNSSRSHTIFRMVIESRDKSHDYKQDIDPSTQDAVRVSTLNLVDLAGSERFSKSGAEGARSKEGAHINKSLTTLGMVINKLSKRGGKQGSHIPYRDSRLTRILQSALGGNARTAIICTINADEIHSDETRSTLQFASRAKRVINCAQVNEILTDAALLKRQKEEIKELRRRLEGSPHTEDLKKEILHLRNDLLKYELAQEFADGAYENTWGNSNVHPINVDSGLSYASSEFESNLESKQAQLPLPVNGSSETSMDLFCAQHPQQLNEKNFLYEERRPLTEFEIQEKTKEAIATANIALLEELLRFQTQEIKKILGKIEVMEVELKACHKENSQLRARTVNLHEQRLRTRAALEQGVQERASQEAENLKSCLHLANCLGNEFLQVLHGIEIHDIRFLESHAVSKETVGKNLEGLQVLLLESAHVGLRLFSNLSSKKSTLAPTKLQQPIQEVAKFGSGDMEISPGVICAKIATICAKMKEFETKAVKLYQRSEIDPDDTQLRLKESVYSIHSTHDTVAMRQGINGWSIDSVAVRNSVGQSSTWCQSLDDASLTASQDPGDDICNIDLHQACDEETGVVLSCHNVTLDMQMPDKQRSTRMDQEYLLKLQVDKHFAEELKITRNMSEAEKQFTKEMLQKVKALEAGLIVADMEIIEYKVEIEHLKMNNLRTSLDASLHCDDWELQNLRVECEIQKEEIRQLMEQVMTPDHELQRESLFRETMERNIFLENCLREAEIRLIRAKGRLEELLQLRDAEIRREKSNHDDIQSRNAVLEKEGVLLVREISEARLSAFSKYDASCERLHEVLKLDTLNEPAARKFQLSSGGAKNRGSLPASSKKLQSLPDRNKDEMERPRGPNCRPRRPALKEAQHNLLQPCTSTDLESYICLNPDIKMLQLSNPSEKENQQCPRILSAASR